MRLIIIKLPEHRAELPYRINDFVFSQHVAHAQQTAHCRFPAPDERTLVQIKGLDGMPAFFAVLDSQHFSGKRELKIPGRILLHRVYKKIIILKLFHPPVLMPRAETVRCKGNQQVTVIKYLSGKKIPRPKMVYMTLLIRSNTYLGICTQSILLSQNMLSKILPYRSYIIPAYRMLLRHKLREKLRCVTFLYLFHFQSPSSF